MKIFLKLLIIAFTTIGLISFVLIIFDKAYFNTTFSIDTELASDFGSFFGGFVGTLFSMLSVVLLIYTIFAQNNDRKKDEVKNNFFRMLDYHNENVRQLKVRHISAKNKKNEKSEGRRAFVIFKLQIHKLIELINSINTDDKLNLNKLSIAKIAYIVFYYGIKINDVVDEKENKNENEENEYKVVDKDEYTGWLNFFMKKLKDIKELDNDQNKRNFVMKISAKIKENPKLKLGRTNQTSLSSYFRNMYNSIKLVDDNKYLSQKEKKELITIYRAQLSNPELYVLFFNLMSDFGKKWEQKDYVKKYEFIKNIPENYCDGYIPKYYFPMTYEYEE